MTYPKYPHITVKLVGEDGNAFAILARAKRAMRINCLPAEEQEAFMSDATSGDYSHLLVTCMRYFDTFGGDDEYEDDDEYEWV